MTELAEKTEFKFAELSERAKDAAREEVREWQTGYDWWDCTYEDAVTIGALMGIQIDDRDRRTMDNSTCRRPAIYFSGFWSQGDGASYEGYYRFAPNAVAKVTEGASEDKELRRIAEGLTAIQVATQLAYCFTLGCEVRTGTSNHSHSMTMSFEFDDYDGPDDDENIDFSDGQDAIIDLLRAFADWIYHQLEAEYNHLTSDEVVDERLAELTFDEDGQII